MAPFEDSPQPPYYAAIFTSRRVPDTPEYEATARRMETLAREQPGFLGLESARDASGFGITVSYWNSEESIAAWKAQAEHAAAQQMGKRMWYEHYTVRVATVHRAYGDSPPTARPHESP